MLQPVPTADPAAEIADWWRLVEIALPSHEGCGAITFTPDGIDALEVAWDRWVDGVFLPVVRPALLAAQAAAAVQDLARLRAAEAVLDRELPGAARRHSLAAGRHLLLAYHPPRGARLLERLRDAAAEDPTAGHLATVFAVRGQVFHLPAVQVAGALLLAECVLGADAAGVTLPAGRTIGMLQGALDRLAMVPAVELLAV